jgi:hypothetical protein
MIRTFAVVTKPHFAPFIGYQWLESAAARIRARFLSLAGKTNPAICAGDCELPRLSFLVILQRNKNCKLDIGVACRVRSIPVNPERSRLRLFYPFHASNVRCALCVGDLLHS